MTGFNADLQMPRSYYAATAARSPDHPVLQGEIDVDLVVIGGGCTGLSAALHAAEAGLSVALLEGGKIGWGASGRNGGQLIPGLRKGVVELTQLYGADLAKPLFFAALEARETVHSLVERFNIDCDHKPAGHLLAAAKPGHVAEFAEEVQALRRLGYDAAEVLSATETRDRLASDLYFGGLLDRGGGHLHPLNYTLGLARAAAGLGVKIYEHSPATALHRGPGVTVETASGRVRAKAAVLAGDALLSGIDPQVERRIMPVASYIGVTAPLASPEALIRGDLAVSDSRFVVNYFRLTADGRLLFGGGERYTPKPPSDMKAFVRPFIERVFPQITGARIDYAWGGLVSVTRSRLPHMGRDGDVYFAHGYSGQGALLSTQGGKLIAQAVLGDTRGLDLFARVAPPPFPGGALLRTPLYTLGMLWFALRDRL